MGTTTVKAETKRYLLERFETGGCVRRPSVDRRKGEGSQSYKKGYEVRFTLTTQTDVARMKKALRALGIEAGSAYQKRNRIVLPVYGRTAVEALMALITDGLS